MRDAARYLLLRPAGAIGLILIVGVASLATFAPILARYDPNVQNIMSRLMPPAWETLDWSHPLGTDGLGRDILSRLFYGARVSLLIGFTTVAISMSVGVILGLIAAYYPEKGLGMLIMRLADVQLGLPATVLYLTIIAIFGPGLRNLILALGITGWVEYARLVHGSVLSLKERQFIEAEVAMGAHDIRIIVYHLLPNVLSTVTVMSSLQIGRKILEAAGLSFLGLGVQPGTPDWGVMVSEGLESLERAWWVSTIPGMAILTTVLGTNLFGDWLRDFFDPQTRRQA